jgi:BMFP domain-containing protein YqiC
MENRENNYHLMHLERLAKAREKANAIQAYAKKLEEKVEKIKSKNDENRNY